MSALEKLRDLAALIWHSFPLHYSSKVLPVYFCFSAFGVLFLLGFEAVYLGWSNSSLKRILIKPSRSSRLDTALAMMYLLNITPFAAVIFSFGLGTIIPVTVKKYFGYNLIHSIPSPWIQAAIYALVYDFFWYWKHRLSHKWKWWWQLHEMHHSATEMNMITANRLHPADEAVTRIFTCLPLAVMGAPPEMYVLLRGILFLHAVLIHSSLPWKWKGPVQYCFVSPRVHQIHHSDLPEHRDKNFGNHFPVWDLLFGTWYKGANLEALYAERPNYHQSSWHKDVLSSYCRFVYESGIWMKEYPRRLISAGMPGRRGIRQTPESA